MTNNFIPKITAIFIINVMIVLGPAVLGFSRETKAPDVQAPKHEFVGASKCAMCHKAAAIGEQYKIWQGSKHAHAYEVLGTPEAKAIAAKKGLGDPQKSGECLRCHSTAYWFSKEPVTDKIALAEGISCETCHGPGKDYMKMGVMKDPKAAVEAGLIIPDETTCRKCHNEESPNFQGFDYEKFWEKIKHPIPGHKH